MDFNPIIFLELLVVLLFGLGWGLLELRMLRIDRKRRAAAEAAAKAGGEGPVPPSDTA